MSIVRRQNGSDDLLLIFNGWGMDENAFPNYDDMDMLIVSEWHIDNCQFLSIAQKYQQITLVAWSLGVWQAANCEQLRQLNIKRAIALNGTEQPIDNHLGIPVQIFEQTLSGLNKRNRDKFQMRMMGGLRNYKDNISVLPQRTLENQLQELEYFWQNAQNSQSNCFNWNKAIVGKADLIFPVENQLNYWQSKTEICQLETAHYPFINELTWQTILE